MKTPSINKQDADREWWVVDLEGQTVGRAAAKIASVLRGKHKPTYTPHADAGDFVVAINADKVVFTGNKWAQKQYYRHSGYPGGIRNTPAGEMLEKFPTRIIESAVRGMLPKNRLGRQLIRKFKVYAGGEHPHDAQQPQPLEL